MARCVISDYKFDFLEDKWYECEGCGHEVKRIHLLSFKACELWICDECYESLKNKIKKKG